MKQRRVIIPYDKHLKKYARKLRNNCTASEAWLWQFLKGRQMEEHDFHRQKPIDRFILDFYCCELFLGIEVDGSSHDDPAVKIKDAIKESRMNELGITLLRFTDEEVLNKTDFVLNAIRAWVRARAQSDTPPALPR
ncbi:endonuclease domain-containing protein [Pseudochryseolinea flava]|uniref:DNA methylase n=1 Tax=Pseudochryseolinea flava TaxID=2059302 RepID=A0A364XXB5_9BACT|nr:endonuclease domain-containing protein [Pseudochryseolinea flava]RAV99084.1 DNA methylase [Pseudochryseolinea flava]